MLNKARDQLHELCDSSHICINNVELKAHADVGTINFLNMKARKAASHLNASSHLLSESSGDDLAFVF